MAQSGHEMTRTPRRETVVPWESDVAVPAGIRKVAQQLGARGCYARMGRVVVVLGDGRECWLNMQGEQTGQSPHGAVPILEDVPWPMASTTERTRAA